MFGPIQYVGSFQNGVLYRSADPTGMPWRKIEQIGTTDNLLRLAGLWGGKPENVPSASLRIRQAIELRNSSKELSPLTRPLMLYYSALNLMRGLLSVTKAGMGKPGHGAKYVSAPQLLDCKAVIGKSGTLSEGQKSFFGQDLVGQEVTLLHCLAQMQELSGEFTLLQRGHSDIAVVRVESFIQGDTKLVFNVQECAPETFRADWEKMFPWFEDLCSLSHDSDFTLVTKERFADDSQVAQFCNKHLLSDRFTRQDPLWFDHVIRERLILAGATTPYLIMLFILSNVARYEPEKLDDVMRLPTDQAYVVNTAINNVDVLFPQSVLSVVYGRNVYFA